MSSPLITPVDARARWIAAVLVASVAAGALVTVSPFAAFGVAAAIAAGVAFSSWPLTLLLAALLVRPALDTSGELISVAGVNPAGMLGVSLVAGGGLALLACARGVPGRRVLHLGSAMLLVALSTLLWSLDPDEGIRIWVMLATPLVVFGLAAWTVRSTEQLRIVAWVVLASAIVPIVIGLTQLLTGDTVTKQGFASIAGPFVHPNGFAFFLLVVILVGVVMFMETRAPAPRIALGIGLTLAVVCLLNTYARAAWIALAAALFLLAVAHYRRLAVVIGVIALLVTLAYPPATTMVSNRFADLSSTSASHGTNSFSWRTENWNRMSDYAVDRPLTGHGLGSYLQLSEQEFGIYDYFFLEGGKKRVPVYAHNDYLDLSVEIGLPGLLLYIATFLALLGVAWQARRVAAVRPYAMAVGATVAVLLVLSAVDNIKSYNAILYVLFALGGAVAGASAASSRKRAG